MRLAASIGVSTLLLLYTCLPANAAPASRAKPQNRLVFLQENGTPVLFYGPDGKRHPALEARRIPTQAERFIGVQSLGRQNCGQVAVLLQNVAMPVLTYGCWRNDVYRITPATN